MSNEPNLGSEKHVCVVLILCRAIQARLLPPPQDGLTGSAWGDWANYTDSPLRAFEDTMLGEWSKFGHEALRHCGFWVDW